ncbi:MAG: SDR family NAD(P)-dependent oxidoreductase [Pseudomonadota bacterium]
MTEAKAVGRVQDKIAIVIGASQGIGAGIAKRLHEAGARVTIADRNPPDISAGERFVPCDVANEEDVEALIAGTFDHYGRVDILCQNAGIFPYSMIPDISVSEWDQVLGVNLRGNFLAIRACLKPMRAQRYGRIVLTSSITGPRVSVTGHAHYSASKAGINGLIRAAALEAAPDGITVNGVEPGNILTEGLMSERTPEFRQAMEASVPLGRLGTPEDVANAVLFLASDEAAYITGTTIIVDGGQIIPESKA